MLFNIWINGKKEGASVDIAEVEIVDQQNVMTTFSEKVLHLGFTFIYKNGIYQCTIGGCTIGGVYLDLKARSIKYKNSWGKCWYYGEKHVHAVPDITIFTTNGENYEPA